MSHQDRSTMANLKHHPSIYSFHDVMIEEKLLGSTSEPSTSPSGTKRSTSPTTVVPRSRHQFSRPVAVLLLVAVLGCTSGAVVTLAAFVLSGHGVGQAHRKPEQKTDSHRRSTASSRGVCVIPPAVTMVNPQPYQSSVLPRSSVVHVRRLSQLNPISPSPQPRAYSNPARSFTDWRSVK